MLQGTKSTWLTAKFRRIKFTVTAIIIAVAGMSGDGISVEAQETNTQEAVIKQLQKRLEDLEQNQQKRIEALERKVSALENEKESARLANEAKLKQQAAEFEQKLKAARQTKDAEARQQIQSLAQQVDSLNEKREATEEKLKKLPMISAGADGFTIASGNENFKLQLKGVLQVDSRTFINDAGIVGNDGLLLRRARPVLQGTVARDFDFLFVPDFGGTSAPQIFDAYVNYRYNSALQLQAGKSKSLVGLETLQQDVDILLNERALPTTFDPGRDLNVQLHGELFDGAASYAAGIFNGVGDYRNSSNIDFDDSRAYEGRVFFQPFKPASIAWLEGFGFGLGGSYEKMQGTNTTGLPSTTGGTLPGYVSDGQQQYFAYNPVSNAVVVADGEHWRLSPQGYYYYGPFGFLGEYAISDQKVGRATKPFVSRSLDNRSWQITGSWILTGEEAAYRGGVTPCCPFDPRAGHWGAVQLVARYAEADIDSTAFPLFSNPATSARQARSWAAGLNWYLNRNIEFKASFSHTDFTGGGGPGSSPPAIVTRRPEEVFFTRVQLAF